MFVALLVNVFSIAMIWVLMFARSSFILPTATIYVARLMFVAVANNMNQPNLKPLLIASFIFLLLSFLVFIVIKLFRPSLPSIPPPPLSESRVETIVNPLVLKNYMIVHSVSY